MLRFTLLIAVVIGLAVPAWAVDGDLVSCGESGNLPQGKRGWEMLCYLVCDTKNEVALGATTGTCSSLIIKEPADTITFEIAEDDDCSASAQLDISQASTTTTDT